MLTPESSSLEQQRRTRVERAQSPLKSCSPLPHINHRSHFYDCPTVFGLLHIIISVSARQIKQNRERNGQVTINSGWADQPGSHSHVFIHKFVPSDFCTSLAYMLTCLLACLLNCLLASPLLMSFIISLSPRAGIQEGHKAQNIMLENVPIDINS